MLGETIPAHIKATAAAHANGPALVDRYSDRRWTYAEFDRDTDALAVGLLERGIKKGDRVGIWAQNVAEWAQIQYATAKIGAILVNVNPSYRSHELEYVVKQSGMSMLVSQITAPPHSDFHAIASEVAAKVPGLELVFLDTLPSDLLGDAIIGERESFARLIGSGRSLLDDESVKYSVRLQKLMDELAMDDPINIQYTSGTTGFPKGVTLSHHNILNNGFFIGEMLGYSSKDSVVLPVPYYHCFGMVIGNLAALSHGAAVILPSPGFDPVASLSAVSDEKATSLYGVPTMFIAELEHPDFSSYDLSSLRTGVMAGSPCPVEIMKRVITDMNMEEVAICYGMTETSPVSMMTRVDDTLEARTQTVGRVMPHLEIKIADPVTGQALPRGQKGELCTRGYAVMLGYWENPEKTAEAIDASRWIHTGDLGIMDDDGYVDISGRIKDMVIRGGENVYPREVEEFLYHHPSIRDVQVVGIPDEKYGEELMAWVILKDGVETLDAAAVREFCSGKLAHFKIPRYVEVRESFPMTVSGKIRKIELREEGEKIVHTTIAG
nr:AMP-binding protein [Brevibacterium antiquum]